MKKGIVYETMRRLAERLESGGIPYAVIGGMALACFSISIRSLFSSLHYFF